MDDKFRKIMNEAKDKYGISVDTILSAFNSVSDEIKRNIPHDNGDERKKRTEWSADRSSASHEPECESETERMSRMTEMRRRERERVESDLCVKQRCPQKNRRIKKNGKRRRPVSETATLIVGILFIAIGAANIIGISNDPDWVFNMSGIIKLILPFAAAGASFCFSLFFKSRSERCALYSVLIGNNDSYELAALSSAADTSVRRVRRDIQNMIGDGDFGAGAYIDVKKQMFFRNAAAAEEYCKTESIRNVGDEKQAEDRVERDEYRLIILEIRRLNDEISDIAVSERIYRIEELAQSIFDYVMANPSKKTGIRTFMSYYLPTTTKLLSSYAKIEKAGVTGENMRKSKESIEKTLDLLVYAFEKQLDSLFAAESLDINSDIDVLEAMLNRDGISGGRTDDIGAGNSATATESNEK